MPTLYFRIRLLAVAAVFAGLASAQIGPGLTPLTCNTDVTVTPSLRGEGFTELTGDIAITCTGGAVILPGQGVPLVNFQIGRASCRERV